MRKSGILLPVASLPSDYGIGAFTREAYEFIDFLEKAHQSFWQVLPMGPTGYGDSPYQSFSTFAGNPYFIDLDELCGNGWLTAAECTKADWGKDPACVDYAAVYNSRFRLLKKAYRKSNIEKKPDYQSFVKENAFWLEDYALYMAIKESCGGKSFAEWQDDLRLRKKTALKKFLAVKENAETVAVYRFIQYLFYTQWYRLKAYANEHGVEIIGDVPIYVAYDSADTWSHPELFQLDKKGTPTGVAGCPPDYFSETGQLWGNPLYRWDYHRQTGYEWWMQRLECCLKMYDVLRIDHFRGFDEYYNIPYGDPTAEFGHWEKGPGYELFDVMKKTLGKKRIIAEDLGFMTPGVIKLVKKTGFPGMKILEFAFDSTEDNAYLPHNYDKNYIVYTGTHDNDTIRGWYATLPKKSKDNLKAYMGIKGNKQIVWGMIRMAMASVADTAIIPLQEYLELGAEARINIPSTLGGNWCWRMRRGECTEQLAEKIAELTDLYKRYAPTQNASSTP